MTGVNQPLKASTDSGFYEVFSLDTTQDITGWVAAGYVYASSAPATALASFTIEKDTSAKTLTTTLTRTAVAALLSDGESSVELNYNLLVTPNTAAPLRFFYGRFTVNRGGPTA